MTSKKLKQNIDTGLWARNQHGTIASVFQDLDLDHSYRLNFHQGQMPAHKSVTFESLDELEAAMREFEPDMRKWHTQH
jgi:UDP-N-acetylglucosamine 2-epimerase